MGELPMRRTVWCEAGARSGGGSCRLRLCDMRLATLWALAAVLSLALLPQRAARIASALPFGTLGAGPSGCMWPHAKGAPL